MIVLVFGGRDFADQLLMSEVMSQLHAKHKFELVIEGDANGADRMAGIWAELHGLHVVKVPALWGRYKHAAGPLRNAAMLKLKPELAIGFPGESGTAHMAGLVKSSGIPLILVSEDGTCNQLQE